MKLPKYFKSLVNEIEKLPGFGPKSALRLALFLVDSKDSNASALAMSLINAKKNLKYCEECRALSDDKVCEICASHERDHSRICVVENIIDMLAIERANFFDGIYHILGGVISPLDEIGEEEINLKKLLTRIENVEEIIFALPAGLEADATFLILKESILHVKPKIKFTKVAIGLPFGSNMDYVDSLTLKRSFENRIAG